MNDYISREALIEMVNGSERPENERIDIGYNEALNDIKQRLEEMPAADVQPVKHGRWIYKGTVNGWDEMACSCCDGAFSTQDREQILDWEFCPHCGAKMRNE